MKLEDIDVDSLDPRVHGNGFIQADLTPDTRLHVWGHPEIPRQRVSTPIHDHIFGFTSTVLKGRMVNVMYMLALDMMNEGPLYMCEAQVPPPGSHDSKLVRTNPRTNWDIEYGAVKVVMVGKSYKVAPFIFHETFVTEPTITIIKKDGLTLKDDPDARQKPRVLVPVGKEPDNEFDRHAFDRDFLLRIIREVMAS